MIDLNAIEARRKAAKQMISDLCKPRGTEGSREWIMHIPAKRTDPDLTLADSVADIPALVDWVKRAAKYFRDDVSNGVHDGREELLAELEPA